MNRWSRLCLCLLPAIILSGCSGKKLYDAYSPQPPPFAQPLRADIANESYEPIEEAGFRDVGEKPLSTFSIDVDRASYSNVRRFLTDNHLPPRDAVRIEELINYFSYDYPEPTGRHPLAISSEVSTCPWNEDHQLVRIGLQAGRSSLEEMPPAHLVFLIDVSGSMQSADKLPLLKSALFMLVEQLRPEDRVAIVTYAGRAGLALPSTSGRLKHTILTAIEKLNAGGSTAGSQGIQLAYEIAEKHFCPEGVNRVILATDGDFNVGITDESALVRLITDKRRSGVFLSILGFGTGNLKDSRMEKLADHGNGQYAYIDNLLEARKVLVTEMMGTLATVAKDVKIQVEFNPTTVAAYRLIGYENRLLADRDFNNDRKDAGEVGAGHSVTALYEIIPAGNGSPGVDRLKYQPPEDATDRGFRNELMTVKCRYKRPTDLTSERFEHVVANNPIPLRSSSDDFRLAAAAAEFGMLLRESEYRSDASYQQAYELARSALGDDPEGIRSEFARLVQSAELLHGQLAGH